MMSLESEQQGYEERLRYRLKILSEQLKADKVKIASHLAEGFEESFRNIKYDESGEIILESVDGRIRFYIWTPKTLQSFVEGQIYSQYPTVQIHEADEDYVAHERHHSVIHTA